MDKSFHSGMHWFNTSTDIIDLARASMIFNLLSGQIILDSSASYIPMILGTSGKIKPLAGKILPRIVHGRSQLYVIYIILIYIY